MQLSFNSIQELDAFLSWASHYRAPGVTECAAAGGGGGGGSFAMRRDTMSVSVQTVGAGGGGNVIVEEYGTSQPPPQADHVSHVDKASDPDASASQLPADETKPADSPEPAKRKRRTKAEIEADTAADAARELLKAQENGTIVAEGTQNAGEAGLEAARATLRDKAQEGAQAPAGTNPFEQPVAGTEGAATAASNAPEDPVVTPFQHLTRAREFIAKHGMPKYNESFAKAELDANVMAYTAEQRAAHLDALAALEQA